MALAESMNREASLRILNRALAQTDLELRRTANEYEPPGLSNWVLTSFDPSHPRIKPPADQAVTEQYGD